MRIDFEPSGYGTLYLLQPLRALIDPARTRVGRRRPDTGGRRDG